MKVKCIQIYNEITKKYQEESPSLTIGKEYHVIEINMYLDGKIMYRILNDIDTNRSVLYRSTNFEVISEKIPSNWCVNEMKNYGLNLGPRTWMKPGFWEYFYNNDNESIKIYENEVKIMLKEEGEKNYDNFKVGDVVVINWMGPGNFNIK